jgi:hypothetical protein
MCEVRSKEKTPKNKTKRKVQWSQQKIMDYDEPHLTSNEKLPPIQWTEKPTATLVAAGSVWPSTCIYILV